MNSYTAMTSDVKLWENHFKKMVNGNINPNKYGLFVVEKSNTGIQKETDVSPHYKMVTPAAQALEIAESDIKNSELQQKDIEPITYFPSLQEKSSTTSTTSTNVKKKRGRPPKRKGVPPIAVETNSQKKKKPREDFWKLY